MFSHTIVQFVYSFIRANIVISKTYILTENRPISVIHDELNCSGDTFSELKLTTTKFLKIYFKKGGNSFGPS